MEATELKNRIQNANIAVVTFTKKNGDKRVMKCTLNTSLLKAMAENGESSYKTPMNGANYNDVEKGLVRVWDLENDGWRTIIADDAVVETCD